MSAEGGPVTAPDRPGTPDGRSAPETAGQAAVTPGQVPEVFARWIRLDVTAASDEFVASEWAQFSQDERDFWTETQAAIAAAAPAPAGEGSVFASQADMFVRAMEGETVIIGFRKPITQQQAHNVREHFKAIAPGLKLVLVDGVDSIEVDDRQPQPALDLARAETAGIRAAAANTARELAEARTALLEIARAAQGSIDGNVAPDLNWFVSQALDGLGEEGPNHDGLTECARCDAQRELAEARELLGEIGVMAANAPEDGDSFGLLEQIAMMIAAMDVEDDGRHPDGCTCQFCREDEREERARADREDGDSMADIIPEDWCGEAMT